MEIWITLIAAILGSTGVWGFIAMRMGKRDNTAAMVKGIAQHMIVTEGTRLLEQGHVSMDEYRNLHRGLFKPYVQLGGNGLAERIVKEVDKLPMTGEKLNERNKKPDVHE